MTRDNPYSDGQPDYWQRNAQFANQLDSVYSRRSSGYRPQQDPGVNAYSIPQSQKVALLPNPQGGLPKFSGQVQTTPNAFKSIKSLPENLAGLNLGNYSSDYNGEIDAGQMLQQRVMQQQIQQSPPSFFQPQQAQQQQQAEVGLVEGYPFFRPLQVQGFGNVSMPVVRTAGNISGVRGPVVLKRVVQVYIADGLSQINMARLHEDTARIKTMAIVQALWTNGDIVVPQEAIVRTGDPQQLLIDRRQMGNPYQQQQMQQQAQQRQVLLNHNVPQQQMMRPQPQQRQLMSPANEDAKALLKRRGLLRG